jgi:phenylacetate-CoA ligase
MKINIPEHIELAPLIAKRFLFYQKSQNWSKDQIIEYQNNKLKEIITYSGKYVPYYRNLFKEIGLDTREFKGIEDMDKIPLLDKETLRTRTDEFISDNVHFYKCKTEKTSGSTGTPLSLQLDQYSRANKYSAVLRAYFWAGYKLGERVFLIKGLSETKKRDYGYDISSNKIFLNSSRMTKSNCIAVAKLIQKFKPHFFVGYARSFIDFINIIESEGISIPLPKGLFCFGESVSPQVRKYLETKLHTHMFDFYSHAENTVMICQHDDHYQYLTEDFFFPEILDEEGNIDANCYGELVGTSFYNYSMPLIRYKTRDYVTLANRKLSKYSFRMVDRIEGRMDDFLILPDGRKIYFAEGALGYAKGVITGQYIQDRIDHIIINLIVDSDFEEAYFKDIEKGLKKRIGDCMTFSFNIVSELEKKSSGKIPFIIQKINTR